MPKPSRKREYAVLSIALASLAFLQSVVVAMIHKMPSGDDPALQSLWGEVRKLGDKIDGVAGDVRALQENKADVDKSNTSRDTAIHELDKQVTAIGKAQAADEATLKAKDLLH